MTLQLDRAHGSADLVSPEHLHPVGVSGRFRLLFQEVIRSPTRSLDNICRSDAEEFAEQPAATFFLGFFEAGE